ncbi:MAG: 1,2-phenylacetyl-CoA epoxidase subunit PaaD [Xanthomonadales bacterium]
MNATPNIAVTAGPGNSEIERLEVLLEQVTDPEIPVLSIRDLGILRDISLDVGQVTVTITTTYSGCPAMSTIKEDIRQTLSAAGYPDVQVKQSLSPAWTTDWMTPQGREKLREYGIAPPQKSGQGHCAILSPGTAVVCPQCGNENTECISEFGSTACKALYRCLECAEPFDYFKCL